jgi:hypothetical protein
MSVDFPANQVGQALGRDPKTEMVALKVYLCPFRRKDYRPGAL